MTLLSQGSALDALRWPTSTARDLLAFLHSGDVLRQALPRLLRIGIVIWCSIYTLLWISGWPAIYQEFERWGLVKAFFAQLIVLGAALVVTRITILRSDHLSTLPADDFLNLRSTAVISRWLGEVTLIFVSGIGLSSLLQPVSASLSFLLGASPSAASAGSFTMLFLSGPFVLLWVATAAGLFLIFYAVANAIDLGLTLEFNTRAERVGHRIS
ncbi:MAG TPA: hypothetical protein VGG20_12695 [Thermoanaerobaculia bacterium]|jgi:hypothetical protein